MNIGDKIRHISSGTTGVITKLGHHTLYWKVTSIGPEPVPGVNLNSIQKTNPLLVGKTYELIKENKMKLTSKQKQLVKEYARKLTSESTESGLMVFGRTRLDNNSIEDMIDETDYYGEWNSREGYWLFPEEESAYDALEAALEMEFSRRGINARFEGIFENKKIKEDMRSIGPMLKKGFNFQSLNPKDVVKYKGKDYEVTHVGNDHCFIKFGPVVKKITNIRDISPVKVKALEESKVINENNTYTMISALREIVDDLLLSTELLIDNNYGKLEHKEFKDAWYKSSNEFEKKFRNIIKNLMKAGK